MRVSACVSPLLGSTPFPKSTFRCALTSDEDLCLLCQAEHVSLFTSSVRLCMCVYVLHPRVHCVCMFVTLCVRACVRVRVCTFFILCMRAGLHILCVFSCVFVCFRVFSCVFVCLCMCVFMFLFLFVLLLHSTR